MDYKALAYASLIKASGMLDGVWEKQMPAMYGKTKFIHKHDGRELMISTAIMFSVDGGETHFWDPSTKRVSATRYSHSLDFMIQDHDVMHRAPLEEMFLDIARRMDRFERGSRGGLKDDVVQDLHRRMRRCEHACGGLHAGHPYNDEYEYHSRSVQYTPRNVRRQHLNDAGLFRPPFVPPYSRSKPQREQQNQGSGNDTTRNRHTFTPAPRTVFNDDQKKPTKPTKETFNKNN